MSGLGTHEPIGQTVGPGIDMWWTAVCSDLRLRTDALLTAKTLAEWADVNGEVRTTVRGLADAVGRRDAAGRARATVERGIAALRLRGYVVRLNEGAPPRERGHYRLVVPVGSLEGFVAGFVAP